jgi:hypothetical protein
MKRLLCGCLIALAGALAAPASAQIRIQPFANPLALLDAKDVQLDLKLTDDQVKKVVELNRKQAEGLKGIGFQEVEKRKKVLEASQKALNELLTAEQARRLKQLGLQQRGPAVFQDPQVVKDLALTHEQHAGITKALQGFGPKWLAIIQAAKGNQQEMQKKIGELNRSLIADMVKGLTPPQQAKWQEMSGPAFAGAFPLVVPNVVLGQPRPQPVLKWTMNDLAVALAEARKTGKPIFVTFRCEA